MHEALKHDAPKFLPLRARPWAWLSVASSAAIGMLLAWVVSTESESALPSDPSAPNEALGSTPASSPAEQPRWQARGASGEHKQALDVGVQLYEVTTHSRALSAGDSFGAQSQLTLGLRNLGTKETFVMVVLIDSKDTLHWVTPEYATASDDPQATRLAPTLDEQRLDTSVVFEDLAPGRARLLSLLSARPLLVSTLEQLPPAELDSRALTERFSELEVREISLHVAAAPSRSPLP